ncbi:MAG TPA: response regulator transcription factor [Actinomycetota bacterium]|nr:response regulator transcription factor [Actinomycetota bacterium]
MAIEEAIARGQSSLKQGRWDDARSHFEDALRMEERPEAVQGLADALWWLGDASGSLRAMERAYAIYRQAGADLESAIMCLWIAGTHLKSFGSRAACSGWIARADRIVEQADLQVLKGWMSWSRSFEATDPAVARAHAEQSLAAAREQGDRDLELCALAELGKALVGLGQERDGMALIDEAMVAAMGGEPGSLDTVVVTCCSMMGACDLAADLGRVVEWCRAADGFMQTFGSPFLYADCRLRYGGVLLATGLWDDAERELLAAARATTPDTGYYNHAIARLATLRIRQGRLEEASSLLDQMGDHHAALLPLAELHGLRNDHRIAEKLLGRYLALDEPEAVERAQALTELSSCLLAQGKFDAVHRVNGQLEALAGKGTVRAAALHAFAAGRAFAASEQPAEAEPLLERAMRLFSAHRLPYETARSRLALAGVLAGQPEVAIAEAQGAYSTFERLGAAGDCDAAAELIRSLGGPARTGPKHVGVLTRREQEVLRLLGAGLSNPEIAERLFVSRKTVSHHVSSILGKLGLHNRVQAAAFAVGGLKPGADRFSPR